MFFVHFLSVIFVINIELAGWIWQILVVVGDSDGVGIGEVLS